MLLSVINNKFERVIRHSFAKLLLAKGYEQRDNLFFLKSGRVGKLIMINRDIDHTHYRQVAIFTIQVQIASDDYWDMNYPDQTLPLFPYQGNGYIMLHRSLGKFFGKRRGDQWLALDATVPEQIMITYLLDLLLTRILPYLDRINSIDNILNEGELHSVLRMQMLGWLGRRDEAHHELRKLIASRHQNSFRLHMIKLAQKYGVI